MPALFSVENAAVLFDVTVTNWLGPYEVEMSRTDLLSLDRTACTPVESLNWLRLATMAELFVALENESCTVPLLPATAMVAAPVRPVVEPRKLSSPVCAEVMTETVTASVDLPTLAEFTLKDVKAEVVP